jgi:hypothetical protein
MPGQRTRYSISVGWMVGTGRPRARGARARAERPSGQRSCGEGRGRRLSTLTPKHERIR